MLVSVCKASLTSDRQIAALLDLAGVELGPTIVTGWRSGTGTTVRCPVCRLVSALDRTWLGQIKTCAGAGCGARMRVNQFVSSV